MEPTDMQRVTAGLVLTLAVVATLAVAARADALIAPVSGPAKIGAADLIVTGQVVAIEDREVEATPNPGAKAKGKYQIAVVQVTEVVKGDAKMKMVRVGYLMPKAVEPPVGGGGPIVRPPISSGGGGYNVKLM